MGGLEIVTQLALSCVAVSATVGAVARPRERTIGGAVNPRLSWSSDLGIHRTCSDVRRSVGVAPCLVMEGSVRLVAYPAKQCPRKVHNEHAPGAAEPAPLPPAVLELIEGGRAFELVVAGALCETLGERLVEIGPGPDQADQTIAAMDARAEVIIGGRLPEASPTASGLILLESS